MALSPRKPNAGNGSRSSRRLTYPSYLQVETTTPLP